MFASKERLAVTLLFVLGLLALAHVGHYLENADATGGRIRQWSVSWTETRFISSTNKGMTIRNCPACSHRRLARRYWIEEEIWKVTINYLDDGEEVRSTKSEKKLRDNNHNFYWWFDHVDGSGSQCGG